MRDLLLTAIVLGMLPYILRKPWYGVLAWSWFSYMNPHRMAYGFAYTMPFAQILAIALLASFVINREKLTLPTNRLFYIWAAFFGWLGICTLAALSPDGAMDAYITILKVQLITVMTMILMRDFQKLNQLLWVIVFSIGFFSVKGGVFTFMTGGSFHVLGPDGTYIAENNSLAVATLMIIPLMVYLNKFPPHPWVKLIMPFCIAVSMFSVVGSQSRGAMLAIGAVGVFFWWKTKRKVVTAIAFVIFGMSLLLFMPQSWKDRVASIGTYQEDTSATSRLDAWQYSFNVANARLTGGGLNSWTLENYAKYEVWVNEAFAAHSIYFSVLNDAGWPGLFLFLSMLLGIWMQLGKVIKATEGSPEHADYNFLSRMLQISVIAFMSGGAFLSLAWFDLAWHIMAMTIVLTQLADGISHREGGIKAVQQQSGRAGAIRRRRRLPGKP